MNLSLNGEAFEFKGQTISDLIAQTAPQKPFAVAVNTYLSLKARMRKRF